MPQTTRQKLLRGIEAAGVGVLSGKEAVSAAMEFYNAPARRAEQNFQTQTDQDKAAAGIERQQQEDTRQQSLDELNRRNVQSEIAERDRRAQPDDPADKKLDGYVNDQGQQTLIFQRPDGSTYEKSFSKVQGKTEKLSDPFEAFAYGSPEEKQAAKDFLTFEKKTGAQYGEIPPLRGGASRGAGRERGTAATGGIGGATNYPKSCSGGKRESHGYGKPSER